MDRADLRTLLGLHGFKLLKKEDEDFIPSQNILMRLGKEDIQRCQGNRTVIISLFAKQETLRNAVVLGAAGDRKHGSTLCR